MAGQSTRDIKRRIQSVKSTQQITKAMEMVSAAKLRRAQTRAVTARPFSTKLQEVLSRLTAATRGANQGFEHPLLDVRDPQRVAYVVISADRGLAGGYNANLIRFALNRVRADEREKRIVAVGRKGRDAFRRLGFNVTDEYLGLGDEIGVGQARELAADLVKMYTSGDVDEVYLIYSQFVSVISQRPVMDRLLPVGQGAGSPDAPSADGSTSAGPGRDARDKAEGSLGAPTADAPLAEYLYEPSAAEVLGILLPRYVENQVYRALLEAKASEHGARMTAMRNASDNADEMISALTLTFNRARQAGITRELGEIVGGAEALAGGGGSGRRF